MHHYEHFWLDPKFWVAISFVVFVALFGRTMWSKLTEMLDKRGADIRAELDEARRLRAEAETMRQQAEADRAAALAEAEQLIAWIRDGRLKPVLAETLPLSRLHDAETRFTARGTDFVGKMVIVPDQ